MRAPTLVTLLAHLLGSELVVSVGRFESQEGGIANKLSVAYNEGGDGISSKSSVAYNEGGDSQLVLYPPDQPYFDYQESTNVTALLGKTAILNCRVKNIGNKTVSWVRQRDTHLLTVGRFTYTTDARFAARHAEGSDDWLLMVHYLQERDAGLYQCQISTTPPTSHFLHLSVVEAETVIEGSPDVYINTGSRLILTCRVQHSPEPPAFIFWYHGEKLVSYDKSRGDVVVTIEKGVVTISRLLMQYARPRDTGVYICAPANSKPKSINVHVIAGDQPAAIVHENSRGAGLVGKLTPFASFCLTCLLHLIMVGGWC